MLIFCSLNGEIIRLNSVKNIETYITTKDPLILFDVVKTLIKYDPSYKKMESCVQCLGNNQDKDFKIKWFFAQAVEPEAIPLIKHLQQKYKVGILTKCKKLLTYYKFFQLHKLGLDFEDTFPSIPFYYIKKGEQPALFDKGVICSGSGNEKGNILRLFLEKNNIRPTQVIMVDDRLKNLKSIELALKKMNIPFTGIWYTKVDDEKHNAPAMHAAITCSAAA